MSRKPFFELIEGGGKSRQVEIILISLWAILYSYKVEYLNVIILKKESTNYEYENDNNIYYGNVFYWFN